MGWFDKVTTGFKKFANKDNVEAATIAGVYVAMADGSIQPEEKERIVNIVSAMSQFEGFGRGDIIGFVDKWVTQYQVLGKEMFEVTAANELKDVKSDNEITTVVMAVAQSVANVDGNSTSVENYAVRQVRNWLV